MNTMRSMLLTSTATHAAATEAGADTELSAIEKEAADMSGQVSAMASAGVEYGSSISEETAADLQAGVDAQEETKRSAVKLLFDFMRDFGEKLSEFPKPGTTVDGAGDTEQSNNPDFYKVKTSKKGRVTPVGSWVMDFADATPIGRTCAFKLEQLSILEDNKTPSDPEVAALKGNRPAIKSFTSRWNGRKNAVRALVRRTLELLSQINAMESYPGAGCQWITDDNGDVVKGPKPILIYDIVNGQRGTKFEVMSVGQFLAFNPSAALEAGGTYASLLKTAERGADDESGTVARIVPDGDVSAFEHAAADMVIFLEKTSNNKLLMRRLEKRDAPDRKFFLLTLRDLYGEIEALYSKYEDEAETIAATEKAGERQERMGRTFKKAAASK